VNALSFAVVIVALLRVRTARPAGRLARASMLHELRAGLAYAWEMGAVRSLLGLVALVSLLGIAHVVLLPVVARDVLAGDARTLGLLSAAAAAGALGGALYLAWRPRVAGLAGVVGAAAAICGLGLAGLGVVRTVAPALVVMATVGFGVMACTAGATTLLHTIVDDDKRGRVMSLYATAFVGMIPLGALLAGRLASAVGASWTLVLCGGLCALGGVAFLAALPHLQRAGAPLSAARLRPCATAAGSRP